ncbi:MULTISPECIES: TetR/AcrR family transcriptional regulator [Pontibacillus]|uniref:TetR/AcrR family transcriptional regulator n=1 Tax=Pontibacillus chungwhensis TaxID=265426 RepID=A0ABY8UW82_9BACI|nr:MULTISPECIES: TetR/AcrR family transcriptional regulator [Pontibacillus]MCD5323304.1 TetR/AcrR family transcriptional regulator [Pontibacillus sp. HN14]WIF96685.1 TetR/AcrR family transcriptional regulator [Pontibacillus chungwhensis]
MAMQKSSEKRERILQAGIQTFAVNGYSTTTIKEVAKTAGVSYGTVFTYFENKEDLFKASVLEPLEEVKSVMFSIPHPSEHPAEQIKETIERQFRFFAQQTTYARMLQYVIGQPERFPDLFKELDQFSLHLREALRPLILKGQEKGELIQLEPNDISDSYLSFINGVRLTFIDSAEEMERWDTFIRQAYLLFGPSNP